MTQMNHTKGPWECYADLPSTRRKKRLSDAAMAQIELCDAPLPTVRKTKMSVSTSPIASGLRKYLERRGEMGAYSIRTVSDYGDGRGRVWLVERKGEAE